MCLKSGLLFGVLCWMTVFGKSEGTPGHFTPTWAVHIEGGKQMADIVAVEHGFINLGQIIGDFYHFHHNSVKRRSISPSLHHHGKLHGDERVRWARQQRILSRRKRDFLPLTNPTTSPTDTSPIRITLIPDVMTSTQSESSQRSDRDLIPPYGVSRRPGRTPVPAIFDTTNFPLNDHRWPQMWYLNRGGGLDMNVIPAWKEGVTGKGIVVTILDDGLEKDHPDLLVNYDPQASYDVNNHDEDPMPRYDMLDSNRHGTRCAGEVAATANNTLCAVGVAFGASVGGVRMLDGDVTDAVEARSLSLNPQHIDIYSASWGPDDDGKTVDGPGELATRAFIEGVTKGRSGKGSIFIWASGNGGRDHDNCNCDGYTNSIWTLSISSATEKGEVPWYSEMCSSTLATTYSSGSMNEKQVVTTDLHHSCTNSHTGTSASAPLAAGICALALEVNRDLTWRDMQHIVVRTAKPANLQASGWRTNGVGRNVSHSFGYGLMDAAAMVQLARTWRTVPAQHRCEVSAPHTDKLIPAKSQVVLQLAVNQCVGVNYLEHVQAKISLTAARRGDLQINLTSPAGTRVTLLATRSHDMSRAGFNSWPFMTVHTWGESPYGIWLLEIHNEGRYMADISQWDMVFYGTDVPAQETDFPIKPKIDTVNTAGELSIGEGEAGQHNSIEEEKASGKWRDSQRVRDDGRVELQPDSTVVNGEDASSSGCLSFVSAQPQHCIECHQDFFLFSGQCFASCPQRTFATHTFLSQVNLKKPKEVATVPEKLDISISSSLRRKRTSSHKTHHKINQNDINNTTYSDLKSIMKRSSQSVWSSKDIVSRNIMLPQAPKICIECHYSCLTCSGPYNYQCLTCPIDAVLYNATVSTGNVKESYCYPSQLLPQLESATWIYRLHVIFFVILIIFVIVVLYFILLLVLKKFGFCKCCSSDDDLATISYNRLGHVDEYTDGEKNISKEIHSAIFNHSDSESDE